MKLIQGKTMKEINEFKGFHRETIKFYEELRENNDKHWFENHRQDYENHVLEPARAFVAAMGSKLLELSPEINASPKVDGSIFRIYRDVRFSPDKSPFKTHLGIWFWEGPRKKMECTGYYFQIEPPILWLGGGMYQIPDDMLGFYRENVVDPKYGKDLERAVREVTGKGYMVGGKHYKRVPRGYDSSHPNAELLLHKGLWTNVEVRIPDDLFSELCIEYCFKRFKDTAPLNDWLAGLLEREHQANG
jgi:uncharacterized protein (TIGR02453 family)